MRIDRVTPKSSFLSVEKDSAIIASEILKNERLKKYLVCNIKGVDPILDNYNITSKDEFDLKEHIIKFAPKITVDSPEFNYLIIKFNGFSPNIQNPEFRNNIIEFDIVCHFDHWKLPNFQQRPFKIAAEIDSMFNKKHLTGIGVLQFVSGDPFILTDEFGGFCLRYKAIHGEEDKTPMPTPEQEKILQETYYPGLLY